MRKFQMGKLQRRTTVTACILAAVSIFVSIALYDAVCLYLIRDRAEELDDMFLRTAVERTNRYLGEIAEIINMATSDENLETLLTADQDDPTQTYQIVHAQNDYERYLRNMILNYGQVGNFIFVYGNGSFLVHEDGNVSYQQQVQDFYRDRMPRRGGSYDHPFYLLNLSGKKTDEMAVVSPVFRKKGEEPAGCIAVVLGEEFAGQLQFAGEDIYMVDQLGGYSSLQGKTPPEMDLARLHQYDLIFEGWKLAAAPSVDSIRDSFFSNTWYFPLLGVGYLAVAAVFAYRFSGKLLCPLRDMNRSLRQLAKRQAAEEHSRYRIQLFKRRLHFRERLLIFYITLALAPVLLSSVGFYCATQEIFDQKIGYFSEHRANFLFDQMGMTLQKYKRTAVELAYHEQIQTFLHEENGGGQGNESTVSQLLLQKQTQIQGIMNIALFDTERQLQYSSFYSRGFAGNTAYDQIMDELEENAYRTCWSGISPSEFNKNRISIGLTVFLFPPDPDAGKKLGYLILDFDATALEGMAADFEKQGNANVYLFGEDGSSLFNTDGPSLAQILENGVPGNELTHSREKQNVLFTKLLDSCGWTAVAEVPRQEYLRERNSIIITCGIIILSLAGVCLFISCFSSAFLSRNLESLVQFVKRIDHLGFSERYPPGSGDEIEELGRSFNEMLDTLDRLISQRLEAERQYRSSQLAAKQFELNLLQSQINPHFLYNTLKTVQYMVHIQDPRAEKMVKLLIHLFRTGISKSERLVTVREELRHVETYLEIQEIRFSDKFEVHIQIEEGAEELYLLKLTLQPIVENAIYHGLELLDRKGRLSITVSTDEESLFVLIEDDGNGMTEERLCSIREKLSHYEKSGSIGLYNVQERIRLYFGASYGITIHSTFHQGTSVKLRFPRIRDPRSVQLEKLQPQEGAQQSG